MSPKSSPVLNKVFGIPFQDTAVGFYRLILPMRALKREGLVKEARITPFSGNNQFQSLEWNPALYPILAEGADILWTTVVYSNDHLQRILNIREQYQLRWVVDVDDNLFDVSNDNPAADHVRRLKRYVERCLSLADGLTVSVPVLKKLYQPLNSEIFVLPNGLDFHKPYQGDDPMTKEGAKQSWEDLRLQPRREHKKIRIGWEGAYGHRADLELVLPVIEQLKKNYDITFVCFGWKPPICDEWHDWVGFAEYPEKLASLNLDIGISPLVDSSYNRCKSNLRYMEFSALGIPTVLSPTENQKDMVGLEASTPYEWYEQLEKLIIDGPLRRGLGDTANQFVKDRFDVHQLVYSLIPWLYDLPRHSRIKPDLIRS